MLLWLVAAPILIWAVCRLALHLTRARGQFTEADPAEVIDAIDRYLVQPRSGLWARLQLAPVAVRIRPVPKKFAPTVMVRADSIDLFARGPREEVEAHLLSHGLGPQRFRPLVGRRWVELPLPPGGTAQARYEQAMTMLKAVDRPTAGAWSWEVFYPSMGDGT
jgi:hypothetical protein